MKRIIYALIALMGLANSAAAMEYINPTHLAKAVQTPVSDCKVGSTWQVPVIAWGGDIATSYANGNAKRTAPGSVMAQHKLDVNLFRQDDFRKQLEGYLRCESPFLRGTMGMINMAAEVANRDPRTQMVMVYQLSWSVGGDALVVRDGIKTPADLKGKTIVLQAYGPHVDYLTTILRGAGLSASDVTIKYVRDLLQTGDKSVSPAMAFRADSSVAAAFVITPDALALTSNGTVGTGAEDSVRGARVLLSTKTADAVIADVYAVRKDFFDANRDRVQDFVHALMVANEKTTSIMRQQGSEQSALVAGAAELLLDSRTAVDDTVGMYGDMRMAGYRGNVKFFGDQNNPRGFDALTAEIQPAFMQLGLLGRRVALDHAKWDYARLTRELTDTAGVEAPRFDAKAVDQLLATRQQQGNMAEGELFRFEIYFGPNQNTFSAEQYRDAFDKVIKLAATYGGALLTVEGHSDPLDYLRQKKGNENPMVLSQQKQAAKNLSFARANAVKDSVMAYAKSSGITLDPSQFGVTGWGVMQPNVSGCTLDTTGDIALTCAPKSKQEWDATRRVVFRVIQVEAESSVFRPL